MMNLLIIEDDPQQIELYIDVIESFNKKSKVQINATIKENTLDAEKALLDPEYDAAIVDLILSNDPLILEGKKIVENIHKKLRFPVFVVSGSIGQIDIEEHYLFKKKARGVDIKEILTELVAIYNTGITKILGNKGKIEEYLNHIFWNHLASSMAIWTEDSNRDEEQVQKTLLRYILSHIQEYLDLTTESDFEQYHPAEFYIIPPIKNKVYTGDIVFNKKENKRYIILTPSCDLAQSKAKEVLLVEIESNNEGILQEKVNFIKKNQSKEENIEDAKNSMMRLIGNSFSNKYHYLPKYQDICTGLINFQKLKTVKYNELSNEIYYERIASINSSFTKDIVARFSFYYSRQGSPDFNMDEVYSTLIND